MKKRLRLLGLRRFAAGFLLSAMLAIGAIALALMAHEARHQCTGHDCPACSFITLCEANLESFGSGIAVAAPLPVACIPFVAPPPARFVRLPSLSQVALKVRLNL